MFTAFTVRRTLLGLALMSSLLLLVAGCSLGTSKSTTSARLTTARRPSPTAAAVLSPTVPAYINPTAPLLPIGWTWYHNSVGHFQVPVAPGWDVGSFYSTRVVLNCQYNVLFFPPGTAQTPDQGATRAARLIGIYVNLGCPPSAWSNPPDQYDVKEPTPITVDGQPVTLWDDDGQGQIYHYAYATFKGQQCAFNVQSWPESVIPGDVKVFLQMLHGFQYTGK